MRTLRILLLSLTTCLLAHGAGLVSVDPGAIDLSTVNGPNNSGIRLTVASDCYIYYNADMQRVLGTMRKGTTVTLAAMTDTCYRVRGRAMHGDTAGWLKMSDLISPDPELPNKLRAVHARQTQISALIAEKQVALGMTSDEVQQSLGRPTRKSSKLTLAGRQERLEYAIFQKVPQTVYGRDQYGQLVQNVVYVKMETGTLSINFKGGLADEIEETKGTPLGGQGVKIVPAPIFFR